MSFEVAIRVGVFGGLVLLLALWEGARPARRAPSARRRRWPLNFGLSVAGAVAMRVIAPLGAVGISVWAADKGLGLLNRVPLPEAARVLAAILALDFAIYLQHRLFHRVPWLWRLHAVHHTDRTMDVSSGIRFHPVEILLSLGYKAVWIVALGIPAAAVVAFEVLLNAMSLFTHANVSLGRGEPWVRALLVTPEMHLIHHSQRRDEHDSNYSFCLSIWDRLLGTYTSRARNGFALGLAEPDDAGLTFLGLLAFPFRRSPRMGQAEPVTASQPENP